MFLVIYETKRRTEARELRVKPKTYATLEEAERAQRQVSHDFRCASWVAELQDPPLVEEVKEGGAIAVTGGVLEVTPEY